MDTSRNTKRILILLSMVVGVVIVAGGPVKADFTFGNLKNLGPLINTSMQEFPWWITPDGLSLWFQQSPSDWAVNEGFVATRATKDDPWGNPVSAGLGNDPSTFNTLGVVPGVTTGDGLEMYVWDVRTGGYGSSDLWMMKRNAIGAAWCQPVNLGPVVNSSAGEASPTISLDGLELYFDSGSSGTPIRPGGTGGADLWVTKRATRNAPWGTPVNLGPTVNTTSADGYPVLLNDGRLLFFFSKRPGGYGSDDVWVTTRDTSDAPWRKPVNLGPLVNSTGAEIGAYMSADGSTLFFNSNRTGGYGLHDIWEVSITCVVDFNGDGKVDGKEVLAMAEHWGQSCPLCDIGPTPMGDGVVDVNDLIVLADHIGSECADPTLLAHWALDESAGSVAMDSVGGHDAMVVGKVVWQANGMIGGALAFDGKENFVRTMSPVLDPAKGPFSVIAWVKGGATNRVIVSQASGADWLYLNPFGMLTTDLKASGTSGTSLTSDAYLLDDQWHRVALVWDGTNRSLQMDGIEVGTDTQPNLAPSSGNLQMGCGKGGGAFWSGLIDDVRVYNRAVSP